MKKFVKETSKKLATGALAVLATIGGASAVTIDPLPNGTSDITISDPGPDNGNIPVYGFQTKKDFVYELNVSWGAMKFVFDRGVYDPGTDALTKRVTNTPWNFCEAGVTDGTAATTGVGVGKWCGFDGDNNHVTVVNKGNGNVQLGVGCTEGITEQTLGSDVDMQIAIANADMGSGADGWAFSEGASTTNNKYMKNTAGTPVLMTIASGTGTAATTTIQKYMNLDGTVVSSGQDRANEVVFYLNITGTPQQTATDGTANSSELDTIDENTPSVGGNYWEKIGDINLTFTPSGDSQIGRAHV